ncbi:MAG: hypothetical protein ABW169_02480 [Sphingobium sp.]
MREQDGNDEMMTPPNMRIMLALTAVSALPGCVAKAAWDVATLPVKAGSQVVDWSTTSQEEADRNRGKEMRKRCKKDYDPAYCDDR